MPGWWAGVGTQALVILVSHLASLQYVLLLLGATESVCEGKQCYKAREGNAEAFLVLFQPPSSPLCPQQHNTETSVVISRTSTRVVEGFGERIVWLSGSQLHLLLCAARFASQSSTASSAHSAVIEAICSIAGW